MKNIKKEAKIKMKVTNVYKVIITAFLVIAFTASMISCKEAPVVEEQVEEEVAEEEAAEEEVEGEVVIGEFEWFQTGNMMPLTQTQPKRSEELEDNRIGDMYTLCPEAPSTAEEDPEDFADRISEKGLKRMRISLDFFDWCEVEENNGPYSKHFIYPDQDKAITGLVKNGIKPIYNLVFWDEEIKDDMNEGYSRFKTEEEIQRYLDYAQFIVHSFKDRIEYYEILNESNLAEGNQQDVRVDDYINLVKRTVPIIRKEDPEAKIIVGAVTPLVNSYDYLFGLLNSDIMPLIDAISWHVGAISLEYEYWREYCINYPSIVQEIKDVASTHGFNGEYIANELQWRTPDRTNPDEPWVYSDIVAAKYLARGIVMNLGMNAAAGLAECLECEYKMSVIQNLCTLMAGAKPINLPIEIQSEATNIRSYSFSLSNNNKLIVLWTDGVAVDEDSGVNTTLILSGLSAQKVIGIDVLHGFEQQLITSDEDGNLVIRNLLVKDYPIILRLSP